MKKKKKKKKKYRHRAREQEGNLLSKVLCPGLFARSLDIYTQPSNSKNVADINTMVTLLLHVATALVSPMGNTNGKSLLHSGHIYILCSSMGTRCQKEFTNTQI